MSEEMVLPDKMTAQRILESLRQGTAPSSGLDYITVGRKFWLDGIKKYYLEENIKYGNYAVKFLSGDYGSGKSHFLSLVRELSFKENYVVSYVVLKAIEAPFSKFENIYSKIILNLSTEDKPEGDSLKWILDSWYKRTYEEIAKELGDPIGNEPKIKAELKYKISELNNIDGMDSDFRSAIKSYFQNMLEAKEDRDEKNNLILGWLKGQKIDKKELKKYGIYVHIKKDNSKEMMKSLVRLINFFGYSGLVILLDEAESIPTLLRAKDRKVAYDNIRELMDNADGRGRGGGIDNCLIIYATTPAFFESREGIKEYDALHSRVKDELQLKTRRRNKRATKIDLEVDPLTKEDMLEIAKKIRAIHSIAFDWRAEDRVTDKILDAYVSFISSTVESADISKPRILVKTITEILDLSEQDEDFDPIRDVEGMIEDQVTALRHIRDEEEFSMEE